MSKIYTRTGDSGETGLMGGKRLPKSHQRIQAIGEVDELNCALGLLLSAAPVLTDTLRPIQNQLFELGAELASADQPARIHSELIEALERAIDQHESALPRLKNFILPGGTQAAALAHLARAVCRRAERALVALAAQEAVNPDSLKYLNRLSDLLFVLARELNHQAQGDIPWQPS